MEFRIEKATGFAVLTAVSLALALPAQDGLRYQVRHAHWWKDGIGLLVMDETGISYQEAGKKNKKPEQLHHGRWSYDQIQQLLISPDKLTLVTYEDRALLLGADRRYEFTLAESRSFQEAYDFLKNRLDRRLVAALADPAPGEWWWELPVKLLGTLQGTQGVLRAGPDRLVFQADRPGRSRTWRYQDLDNASMTDPYELTLTTYERARRQYGSRKSFRFQLKRPLEEERFDALWRRLNREKGLKFLISIEERSQRGT